MAKEETQNVEVKKKWYEEQNGYGFEGGDVVYIDPEHMHVGGRFAEVIGPSDKPNHLKAKMQNPKSGELQRSVVVLDSTLLTLVAKEGIGNDVLSEVSNMIEMEPSGIYKYIEQLAKAQ